MDISEAIDLIRFTMTSEQSQIWADLGCGDGVFTKALGSLLPDGSRIHAIDINERALRQVPDEFGGVKIEKSVLDFTLDSVVFHQLDGIMMANSLHYVKEQKRFVKRMIGALKAGGLFLLVDYDMNKANHWVPYPLPIVFAEELFLSCGAESFNLLNKRRSVFREQWMYSALIRN